MTTLSFDDTIIVNSMTGFAQNPVTYGNDGILFDFTDNYVKDMKERVDFPIIFYVH